MENATTKNANARTTKPRARFATEEPNDEVDFGAAVLFGDETS